MITASKESSLCLLQTAVSYPSVPAPPIVKHATAFAWQHFNFTYLPLDNVLSCATIYILRRQLRLLILTQSPAKYRPKQRSNRRLSGIHSGSESATRSPIAESLQLSGSHTKWGMPEDNELPILSTLLAQWRKLSESNVGTVGPRIEGKA